MKQEISKAVQPLSAVSCRMSLRLFHESGPLKDHLTFRQVQQSSLCGFSVSSLCNSPSKSSFFIKQWTQHIDRSTSYTIFLFLFIQTASFNFNIVKLHITKQVSNKNLHYLYFYIYIAFIIFISILSFIITKENYNYKFFNSIKDSRRI